MNDFKMLLSPDAESYFSKQIGSNKAIKLRLKNSGCSGFSYVLDTIEKNNSNRFIKSIPFDILDVDIPALNNTLIDIKKDGINNKIIFDNPQAYNECGCGESFSIRK